MIEIFSLSNLIIRYWIAKISKRNPIATRVIGTEKLYESNLVSLIELNREEWKGHTLNFHYLSNYYYDLKIDGFNISFERLKFNEPYENMPDDMDRLFQDFWDDIKAWGIVEDGELVAVIETVVEEWSNRLRVSELWIADSYRRQGIGHQLMDLALKWAKDEGYRALILETQSGNDPAISFYLKYGFKLIGFDTCTYSNNDMREQNVRLELGYLLD